MNSDDYFFLFKTLEILETHRTNWRKQWSGNAFMACGVLYVLKKEQGSIYLRI